ncbi:hypothetical protein ACIQCQ_25450 [Streptomyces sp. NPDC088394]|uniref:hypothetical protein n=1 Tax=Streptomyces sp. NPDC088394 TaxID=3365860 RepID=UPI00382B4387
MSVMTSTPEPSNSPSSVERKATLPWYAKLWGCVQDATVGYGFRPIRVSGRLLALLLLQVALTAAGHDLVEATVDQVLLREVELTGEFTPDQRNRLTELLHLLLTDVQQRIGDDRITQVGGEE